MASTNQSRLSEEDYLKKIKHYETKEDDLRQKQRRILNMIDEVEDRSYHKLRQSVSDPNLLREALHQSKQLKDDVFESMQKELRNVVDEREALMRQYYQDKKTSSNNNE